MRNRLIGFLAWLLLVLIVFWIPLQRLIRLSFEAGYSSHIVLIPFVAAYLIWSDRSRIFAAASYSRTLAASTCGLGVLVAAVAFLPIFHLPAFVFQLLTVISVLLLVLAGFVFFFGSEALNRARFPILLLVLILPMPAILIEKIIQFLQVESANLSEAMFSMLGVPVLRSGFLLTIPGVTVEVAKECSGINSSIALLIITLLVAHETLNTTWRRVLLVTMIIPLSIVKNAIRIVTLTMLATRVDPSFLSGRLHQEGGFVFFLITLALGYPIWKLLRKGDAGPQGEPVQNMSTSLPSAVI